LQQAAAFGVLGRAHSALFSQMQHQSMAAMAAAPAVAPAVAVGQPATAVPAFATTPAPEAAPAEIAPVAIPPAPVFLDNVTIVTPPAAPVIERPRIRVVPAPVEVPARYEAGCHMERIQTVIPFTRLAFWRTRQVCN